MNKTQKADWATEADYEKAFAYIEEKQGDTTDVWYYRKLLEGAGKTVFVKDLKEWVDHLGKIYESTGFTL
jgi:hypothetical protein